MFKIPVNQAERELVVADYRRQITITGAMAYLEVKALRENIERMPVEMVQEAIKVAIGMEVDEDYAYRVFRLWMQTNRVVESTQSEDNFTLH